ncbi:MAG: response regulator [Treponema sp.]|jgi:YesN/AraC family two-component response regulator|nr:response regulator [Treponema sp.]
MTKILVVDDEKNIRAGIQKILSEEFSGGIVLFEAKNGEDALELAVREKPDILITDIRMPKMDGLELMRRLRLSSSNKDIHIIVLSGYDEFSYAQKAINYHASSYILKPVDRKELMDAVRSLMREGAGPEELGNGGRGFIDEALAWIKDHLTEDITMAQAANQVSVNYSYFSEKFKKQTGVHFNEYLKRRRVALATRLLMEGNYRVYEVAKKCGYRDVKYFFRQFKEITGISPGKWSRLHRTPFEF